MNINKTKEQIFSETEVMLNEKKFEILSTDRTRLWGGFFVINEQQSRLFYECFFKDIPSELFQITAYVSPKVLVIAPGQRLSWQYHHRRSEIWKVLQNNVGVIKSDVDFEDEVKIYSPGNIISIKKEERHRLVGLNDWGIVAEIWQHTDHENPSNENDIIRIQDDFGRK